MADELKGKVAVVTGGTQGIGLEIARQFSLQGATVVLSGRSLDKAQKAASKISAETHQEVSGLAADVSKSADVEAMANYALDKYKGIDILVNNAGIAKDGLLMRMSEAQFDEVLATNLKGAFLCCKVASRAMLKARSGSIINISSVVGISGNAGQVNYAASKAGLIGLTKSIAKELASRSIRCNAVAPGFITTAMTGELSEQAKADLLGQIPLSRFGEAVEIADACVFLASDRSRFITGQVLRVDGGMMM
jgi:3-oxoacyl-[acyl-carrier protein] reductase